MAGDDRSADVASVPMAVNGSGGSQDRDSAELSGDFLADLDAWFASVDGDGEAVDPLPITPPLAGAIADVGLADSLPVDSISAGSSVHAQPQPLPHKPKNSTQRQKEELQYLRGKASELEAQLKTLKRGRETDPASTEATNNTCAAWKDVAKRQRTARNKAEEEKATLVDTIQRQLKVARGLEKLLSQPAVSVACRRRRYYAGECSKVCSGLGPSPGSAVAQERPGWPGRRPSVREDRAGRGRVVLDAGRRVPTRGLGQFRGGRP
jgi:hypothetical protein